MPYQQGKADFNESTYSMYLITEIQRWLHEQGDMEGVALLPSLQAEADVGYDVAIPRRWAMLYLQFKMPRYLRRSSASEYATFGGPYFRFAVKTDATLNGKEQHNVLCVLEGTGAAVFYASPCFLTDDELSQYVFNDGMYLNSVFPRPLQLGTVPRDSQHCFAYTNTLDARAFSEPGPPVDASFESVRKEVLRRIESAEPMSRDDFFAQTMTALGENIGRSTNDIEYAPDLPVAQKVALLSSTIGLFPFLVTEARAVGEG